MLGQAVVLAGRKAGHEVCADNTDLMLLDRMRGEVLINCAGLVKQRPFPNSEFIRVNSLAPHLLAERCDVQNARLIHVSTDCLFVGQGPHDENSISDATDIYAVSKRAGEITQEPHLTVRTSFVGEGERGLIAELRHGLILPASKNLLWSGHTVNTIARLLIVLAERSDVSGLLHIPGEFQSRFELIRTLIRTLGLGTIIDEDDSFVADRRLVSARWQHLGLPQLPSFAEQVKELVSNE